MGHEKRVSMTVCVLLCVGSCALGVWLGTSATRQSAVRAGAGEYVTSKSGVMTFRWLSQGAADTR